MNLKIVFGGINWMKPSEYALLYIIFISIIFVSVSMMMEKFS